MKFVTVSELRGPAANLWKALKAEPDLVVTSNGKPIAIITKIDESTLEDRLASIRRDRAVWAVREIQEASARRFPKGMSLRKINAEIKAVRAKRPR